MSHQWVLLQWQMGIEFSSVMPPPDDLPDNSNRPKGFKRWNFHSRLQKAVKRVSSNKLSGFFCPDMFLALEKGCGQCPILNLKGASDLEET